MKNTAIQCWLFVAGIAVALPTFGSSPMEPTAHPMEFCSLAAEYGYPSRGYKPSTGGCASNMTDLKGSPGKNGLKNNLAFYSMGEFDNPAKLMRVSLILNVNNTQQLQTAQKELARVAVGVGSKIVGALPEDFHQVILKAGSKSWRVGPWSVEVVSDKWRTGLGQDTTVYFREPQR